MLHDHYCIIETSDIIFSVPPAIIEISGQPTGSEVEVPYDEESLMLRCECRDGKPAAVLTWFRNDEEVDADQVVTITEDSSTAKLKNSISTLTINPKREDNKATYRCRATGDAMQPPLDSISTFITLSVMCEYQPIHVTSYFTQFFKPNTMTLKLIKVCGCCSDNFRI